MNIVAIAAFALALRALDSLAGAGVQRALSRSDPLP
jgi:hypothetical protein